jgi:hypothetical protein
VLQAHSIGVMPYEVTNACLRYAQPTATQIPLKRLVLAPFMPRGTERFIGLDVIKGELGKQQQLIQSHANVVSRLADVDPNSVDTVGSVHADVQDRVSQILLSAFHLSKTVNVQSCAQSARLFHKAAAEMYSKRYPIAAAILEETAAEVCQDFITACLGSGERAESYSGIATKASAAVHRYRAVAGGYWRLASNSTDEAHTVFISLCRGLWNSWHDSERENIRHLLESSLRWNGQITHKHRAAANDAIRLAYTHLFVDDPTHADISLASMYLATSLEWLGTVQGVDTLIPAISRLERMSEDLSLD